MAQDPKIIISGLYTNASDIAGGPPGGLTQCMNIDLSKANLAQCRRGFDLLNVFPDSSYRASKLWDYQTYIYAYFNSTVYNYVAGAWVSRGSVTKPTNALVPRVVFANNNIYTLSNLGLLKTDLYTTSMFTAGLPTGVTTVLTESTATGTAVDNLYTVNYRWLIATKDANNNLIQGPVSSAVSFYNSGGGVTNDVCVLGYLPTGLTGTKTVQVYRSAGALNQAVFDELKLVYEYQLNTANISAVAKSITSANTGTEVLTSVAHGFQDGNVVQITLGTLVGPTAATNYVISSATTDTFKLRTLAGAIVDITTSGTATATSQIAFAVYDVVPDALQGAALYTSPSQNGISQNNVQPPLATDITIYKDFAFYADTQSKQTFNFAILAVDSGLSHTSSPPYNGLIIGDTITIAGEVYTAAAAAVYGSGSGSFIVTSSGVDASLSVRVDKAARSLVDVINRSSALVNATLVYTDSSYSLPGKIMLEAKTLAGAAFTVLSSTQSAFNPQLPAVATATSTSTADTFRNGLMFSRQGLPEAVPALNQFRVGSADDPILRILALRDAMLIFKRRDGTYILRGDNPGSFSVQLLDSTARLVAGESLAIVNGLIYGLFESGICSVSDTSVVVISESIKDKIQNVYGTCLQQVKDYSFGISYESENMYILSIPLTSSDTTATYQIVYNVAYNTFAEWNINASAGYVSTSNQKLYIASGNSAYVKQERKAFDATDFCDYAGTKTITTYATTLLSISSGIDSFSIGDLLSQGTDEPAAYVTAVDLVNSQVTIDYARTWTTGVNTVDHYQAINCILEWAPIFGDNPAGFKHFQEVALLFKASIIRSAQIDFNSDTTSSVSSVTISGDTASAAWGVGTWGISPWGGVSVPEPIRVGVPRDVARCNELTVSFTHKVAQSDWQLQGLVPVFWPTSTRVAR
jgi:hypothetical protein